MDNNILKPHENQNVDLYGQGLERFNIVIENLPNVIDSQTMFDEVLSKTKFSLAYDPTNEWCSEFTSESEKYGDLTVDTPADEFKEILEDYAEKYQTIEDKRDDETLSYSAHSSVYDLNTLSLKVKFDETDEIFEFKMFTDDAMNDRVNSLEVSVLEKKNVVLKLKLVLRLNTMMFQHIMYFSLIINQVIQLKKLI